MLIDDIEESRAEAVTQVTEHARRTALGAKAANTITEHLAGCGRSSLPSRATQGRHGDVRGTGSRAAPWRG
jgi:hypothetical protein